MAKPVISVYNDTHRGSRENTTAAGTETRKSIDDINARGASIGLDMRYDKSRYTNTFDAHRVTKLAQSKGDDKIVDTLQERRMENVKMQV